MSGVRAIDNYGCILSTNIYHVCLLIAGEDAPGGDGDKKDVEEIADNLAQQKLDEVEGKMNYYCVVKFNFSVTTK